MVDTSVAYAVTRVKARKPKLIQKDEFNKILQMDDANLVRHIGDLGYSKEFNELVDTLPDHEVIERGVLINMAREFDQIVSFTKGDLKKELETYLGRIDIENLITILRHEQVHDSTEKLFDEMIPYGIWTKELMEILIGLPSWQSIVEYFSQGYWFSALVRRASQKDLNEIPIGWFEDELMKHYFVELVHTLKEGDFAEKHLENLVRKEIDIMNGLTAVKFLGHKVDIDKIVDRAFIPGGQNISQDQLKNMLSVSDIYQLQTMLREVETFQDSDMITNEELKHPRDLARALTSLRITVARRFSRLYPLSVLPIIHYIIMKEQEVENLQVLSRGKNRKLPREMISSLLVM